MSNQRKPNTTRNSKSIPDQFSSDSEDSMELSEDGGEDIEEILKNVSAVTKSSSFKKHSSKKAVISSSEDEEYLSSESSGTDEVWEEDENDAKSHKNRIKENKPKK
ncbi:hypothetical protein HK096_000833, partial [Nowakowskiella sp. JEL0078]